MDTKKLTIGQMAKLNHITKQTLRLYDKKGLLKPAYIDKNNGYRFYDVRQSSKLDIIQTLQAYGMTLREIKSLLKSGAEPDVKEILRVQKLSISGKIAELKAIKRQIDIHIDNINRYENLQNYKSSFLLYMPDRQIYRYQTELDYFNCANDATYELMLRELKSHMALKGISLTFFHNIGTLIAKENIKAGRLSTREVFLLLSDDYAGPDIDIMPAGIYYCRCSCEMEEEASIARKILEEIRENSYEICGDYYCEVIHELPVTRNEHRKVFYMIQIPVKNRT